MQYTIDAKGTRLGRLASEVAKLLNGKDSPSYTRNIEAQNSVHVINASALYIDPRKLASKSYSRFSGYPGGLKKEKMPKTIEKKGIEEIIKLAVYGMLPSNRLRGRLMKKLKVSE